MLESLNFKATDSNRGTDFIKKVNSNVQSGVDFLSMLRDTTRFEVHNSASSKTFSPVNFMSDFPLKYNERALGASSYQNINGIHGFNQENFNSHYEVDYYADNKNFESSHDVIIYNSENSYKLNEKTDSVEFGEKLSQINGQEENLSWVNMEDEGINDEKLEKVLVSLLGKEQAQEFMSLMKNKDRMSGDVLKSKLAKILKGIERYLLGREGFNKVSKSDLKKLNNLLKELVSSDKNSLSKSDVDSEIFQARGKALDKGEFQGLLEQIEKILEKKKAFGKTGKRRGTASGRVASLGAKNELSKSLGSQVSGKVERDSGTATSKEGFILQADKSAFSGDGLGSSMNSSGNDDFGGQNLFGSKGINQMKSPNLPPGAGRNIDFRKNLNEIINRAKITVRDNKNAKFTVNLYPRELGSLNMSLSLENGVVHGRFIVDSQEARDSLMQNMGDLKEQLRDSGIDIGDFSVGVRDEEASSSAEEEASLAYLPGAMEEETPTELFEVNAILNNSSKINVVI